MHIGSAFFCSNSGGASGGDICIRFPPNALHQVSHGPLLGLIGALGEHVQSLAVPEADEELISGLMKQASKMYVPFMRTQVC